METGKIFLIVLVSVICTYAALTAWPAIRELATPKPTTNVTQPPAALPGVMAGNRQVSAPSNLNQSPTTGTAPATGRLRGTPVVAAGLSGASSTPYVAPWDNTHLKYASHTLVMHARPGGLPIQPPNLNRAPLTVMRGTRLMTLRSQGEWVMVQDLSADLGWVMAVELVDERPMEVDHASWRY